MSVTAIADYRADSAIKVRKELVGAMTMLMVNRSSPFAVTRFKAAITNAHGHGQLTEEQTTALFKLYDLGGA